MMPPPLWLDVTETLASGLRTGIQRVTIELARELLRLGRGKLIRLDPNTRSFVVLTAGEAALLFDPTSQPAPMSAWQSWAARCGLVRFFGLVKDGWLRLSLLKPAGANPDWAGGTYLTAEVLGNLARFEAVKRLQTQIPTALMFHDLFPLTAPQFSALRRRAFARHWDLSVTAARLVAVSHHTHQEALRYATDRQRALPPVAVVHPGHSLAGVEEAAPDQLPPKEFYLCVGTLEHRKNQAGLLIAYLRYRDTGGKAALVIAGRPGPGSDQLVQTVERASTQGVLWYRDTNDAALKWLYRRAQALVYPSWAEGFGLPLVEALALGTPCVTSSRTSTAEVADLCGGCIVVDPEDTQALTLALYQFDAPEFREQLVRTIRQERIPTWEGFFAGVEQACRG